MKIKKLTPVLFVEAIEPCLPFWMERLGFEKTVEVPEGDPSPAGGELRAGKLGFVILVRDGVEVMYQTWASAAKDVPAVAAAGRGPSFLYVEIENFEEVARRLAGAEVVIPERKTFYGAREIGVREPGGHFVTFAEFETPPPAH